jgi:hypothetical protein
MRIMKSKPIRALKISSNANDLRLEEFDIECASSVDPPHTIEHFILPVAFRDNENGLFLPMFTEVISQASIGCWPMSRFEIRQVKIVDMDRDHGNGLRLSPGHSVQPVVV